MRFDGARNDRSLRFLFYVLASLVSVVCVDSGDCGFLEVVVEEEDVVVVVEQRYSDAYRVDICNAANQSIQVPLLHLGGPSRNSLFLLRLTRDLSTSDGTKHNTINQLNGAT